MTTWSCFAVAMDIKLDVGKWADLGGCRWCNRWVGLERGEFGVRASIIGLSWKHKIANCPADQEWDDQDEDFHKCSHCTVLWG